MPGVYSTQCHQWQKAAKMRPPRGYKLLGKACSYEHSLGDLQPGHVALGLASSHSMEGSQHSAHTGPSTTQPHRRCLADHTGLT